MIGNDIVDLGRAAVESNWKRKGFLSKICHAEESRLILASDDPEKVLWVLWSMKEAVYKAWNRQSGIREYAPSKILCKLTVSAGSNLMGEAEYYGYRYCTLTEAGEGFIHTFAHLQGKPCPSRSMTVHPYPRRYEDLLKQTGFLPYGSRIVKENGVPSLCTDDNELKRPLSISHHGKYLGVVLL